MTGRNKLTQMEDVMVHVEDMFWNADFYTLSTL